jgi:L-ascorbate metabolism protein UlaG (beta-lactamase superfamily)
MDAATITWLGHASFRIDSPGGKRICVIALEPGESHTL